MRDTLLVLTLISLGTITWPTAATAATLTNCGKEAAVSGSCPNLSVKLDLGECEKGGPVAAQVTCKGDKAVASYKTADRTYRAVFKKGGAGGWGGQESWTLDGSIWASARDAKNDSSRNVAVAAAAPPNAEQSHGAQVADTPPAQGFAAASNTPSAMPMELHTSLSSSVAAPTSSPDRGPAQSVSTDTLTPASLLAGFTAKGSVDAYYAFNFNGPKPSAVPTGNAAPPTDLQYHLFDFSHDTVQLALARLQLQKQSGPLGITLDWGYGQAMQAVSGQLTDNAQINLKQAIVSYKTSFGLNLEVGRFVTPIGLEVIESQDNWNYSRSLMFGWLIPFWHQGVKASYGFGPVTVMAMAVNGWNNSYDSTGNKGLGGQISYAIADGTAITVNYLTGKDDIGVPPAAANEVEKQIVDVIATFKVMDSLSFAANANYLTQKDAAGTSTKADSVALYARYMIDNSWAIAPRVELFNDADGAVLAPAVAGGQKITSMTLTLENKVQDDLVLRLEGRQDTSDKDAYIKNASAVKSQSSAVLGVVATF